MIIWKLYRTPYFSISFVYYFWIFSCPIFSCRKWTNPLSLNTQVLRHLKKETKILVSVPLTCISISLLMCMLYKKVISLIHYNCAHSTSHTCHELFPATTWDIATLCIPDQRTISDDSMRCTRGSNFSIVIVVDKFATCLQKALNDTVVQIIA